MSDHSDKPVNETQGLILLATIVYLLSVLVLGATVLLAYWLWLVGAILIGLGISIVAFRRAARHDIHPQPYTRRDDETRSR